MHEDSSAPERHGRRCDFAAAPVWCAQLGKERTDGLCPLAVCEGRVGHEGSPVWLFELDLVFPTGRHWT